MPYRSPGVEDPRQEWLLRQVNDAQRRLDAAILEAEGLPTTDRSRAARISRYNALKREVDGVFTDLDKSVRLWSERDVPSIYRSGWFVGASQTGAGFEFTLPHREAIDVLSYDAYDDVGTRLQQIAQGFSDTIDQQKLYESLSPQDLAAIQTKSRDAIAQALLTGDADPRKVARRLAQDLWTDNPRLQIIDAGGKQWKMETYTRMLVRTKSANAYNSGSLNKYAEEGVKRVQVFDGTEDDEACADANGKVWTLRYAMNHVIEHPNCRRAFAPKPGTGDVHEDTENEGLVTFDRVELSVAALAALRYFRQTGEVNVSSTLARLVFEGIETFTFPMPLVDNFITGLASQGLKEADEWIESFIDPVLYHAGIIRNMPTRARLRNMNRPATFLDNLANTIKEANQEAFGVEYHPQVRAVLDRITRYSQYIDRGVYRIQDAVTDHDGAFRFIEPIVDDILDMNRFGQITAETLIRYRDGGYDDLREAYEASVFVLDQFREVRRLHIALLDSTLEEAVEIYDELDRIAKVTSRILAEELSPDDAPLWYAAALERYAIATADLRDLEFRTRRLTELLNEVRSTQDDVVKRITRLESIGRTGTARKLAFPVSSGPDIPSEATTLWNEFDFADSMERFARRISIETSDFDTSMYRRITNVYEFAHAQGPVSPAYRALRESIDMDRFATLSDEALQLLGKTREEVDPEEVAQAIAILLSSINESPDGFYTIRRLLDTFELDEDDSRALGEVLEVIRDRFYDSPAVRDLFPDAPLGTEFALLRESILEGKMADILPDVDHHNIQAVLKHIYGRDSVEILSDQGINLGPVLKVTDEDGFVFTVKNLSAQQVNMFGQRGDHTGGPHNAAMSYILTNWLSDALNDSVEVVPTRVLTLNANGDAIVTSPFVDDMVTWFDIDAPYEIGYDNARKFYLFDVLSLERDAHPGNILADYSDAAYTTLIDREASFLLWTRGRGIGQVDQRDAALQVLMMQINDAWPLAEDAAGSVDRPVRFYQLTAAELDDMLGGDIRFDDPIQWDPGNWMGWPIVQQGGIDSSYNLNPTDLTDIHIPLGRVGVIPSSPPYWRLSVFPTDSELAFIQRVLADPDGLQEEIAETLTRSLEGINDALKARIVDDWAPTSTLEDAIDRVATHVAESIEATVRTNVDAGIFNTSGTSLKHVNRHGSEFTIGDTVRLTKTDEGLGPDELRGVIFNITEDSDEEVRLWVLQNAGYGLDEDELLQAGGVQLGILVADDYVVEAAPLVDVPERVRRARSVIDETKRVWDIPEVDDAPKIVQRLKLDDLGLPVGIEEAEIDATFAGSITDGIRVVDEAGNAQTYNSSMIWGFSPASEIVERELSRLPAEYRPRRIRYHLNVLETADGKPTFGFYDVDNETLHISIGALIDYPYRRISDETAGFLVDDVSDIESIARGLNWDLFREVLDHELGHAVEVGIEQRTRARVIADIVEDLTDEFPDALTRRDLNEAAKDLLPQSIVRQLDKFEDPLDALVQTRADLIEDIINTNARQATINLLDENPDALPSWARSAYTGIMNGDEDAHHEFFAEVWRRVAEYGGGEKAVARVADDLGIPRTNLQIYLDRPPLPKPPNWNLSTVEFQIWLNENLVPGVTRIYPRRRSTARVLHRSLKIDPEQTGARLLPDIRAGEETGATLRIDGTDETEGIMVSLGQFEEITENVDELTDDQFDDILADYFTRHEYLLDQNPELRYGIWIDEEGKMYLDVSRQFEDRVDAASFGYLNKQRAMFDINTFDEIDLLDAEPDFYSWMRRNYPEVDFETYQAERRNIPAVRAKRTVKRQPVTEVKTRDDGLFANLTVSDDTVFSEKQRQTLTDALEDYVYAPTQDEVAELRAASLNDLQNRAKSLDIRGRSRMSKDELVEAIGFAQANKGIDRVVTVPTIRQRMIRVLEMFEKMESGRLTEAQLTNPATGQVFPNLREKYRFYERWRDILTQTSRDTGVPAPNIIAGAARMSAGLDADQNLSIAVFMAEMVGENSGLGHRIGRKDKESLIRWLRKEADRYLKEFNKPQRSAEFLAWADHVENLKGDIYLNQFDPVLGTYALKIIFENAQDQWTLTSQYGYRQFQVALASMQTRISVADTVPDTKVAAFYNNIIDPENLAGLDDVTSDFHMHDIAVWGIGGRTNSSDEPRPLGIGAGLRPFVGDTVRELFYEGWGDRVGARSPGELQEILWGMWRDGKDWDLWDSAEYSGPLRQTIKQQAIEKYMRDLLRTLSRKGL